MIWSRCRIGSNLICALSLMLFSLSDTQGASRRGLTFVETRWHKWRMWFDLQLGRACIRGYRRRHNFGNRGFTLYGVALYSICRQRCRIIWSTTCCKIVFIFTYSNLARCDNTCMRYCSDEFLAGFVAFWSRTLRLLHGCEFFCDWWIRHQSSLTLTLQHSLCFM